MEQPKFLKIEHEEHTASWLILTLIRLEKLQLDLEIKQQQDFVFISLLEKWWTTFFKKNLKHTQNPQLAALFSECSPGEFTNRLEDQDQQCLVLFSEV